MSRSAQNPSKSELHSAFLWLASGSERLTLGALRAKIAPFFPDLSNLELATMMGGKTELTEKDLRGFLAEGIGFAPRDFDAVEAAFAVLDPSCTGVADPAVLSDLFSMLGNREEALAREDMAAIVKAAKTGQLETSGSAATMSDDAEAAGGEAKDRELATATTLDLETFRGVIKAKEGGGERPGDDSSK